MAILEKIALGVQSTVITEALVAAVLPVIHAHGGKLQYDNQAEFDRCEADVLRELRGLIPETTVNEAVALHALLTNAAEIEPEGPTYDALYMIYRLMEDFICRATSTSVADVLSRFEFFKKANDDGNISDDNVDEYLNALRRDLHCLVGGPFGTFSDYDGIKVPALRPYAQRFGSWSHRCESR